ncbi:amidase family protein [Arthrobacter sp. TMN-49]
MNTFPRPISLLHEPDDYELSKGQLSPLAAIDEYDRFVRAFVPEPGRSSRIHGIAALDRSSGVFRGALIGVKDVIRVDGLETRAGSALPPKALAGPQATLVNRLQEAGAIVAGKTVTAEFAVSAPGPTRNPKDLMRTPGGSSSGSAAAVAAGMVPVAVGTQTVGSIIRPAAFCGVMGFRPTWGAIPTDGVIANSPSLDTVGLFASDLASIELAAGVLCNWRDNARSSEGLPILGVPTENYLGSASAEGLRAFRYHLNLLRAAGYEIREASLTADIQVLHHNLFTFQRFELAQVHAAWWREYSALYHPSTAAAIRDGQVITEREYQEAGNWRAAFCDQIAATMSMNGIDIWVTPSAPGLAPRGLSSTGDAVMSAPFSFAGLPAMSLPAPNPAGGIPFGLQCVAAEGQDQVLLGHAHGIADALTCS